MSYLCSCCGLTVVEATAQYWQKKRDALKVKNMERLKEMAMMEAEQHA